jgi:hypothetical protein
MNTTATAAVSATSLAFFAGVVSTNGWQYDDSTLERASKQAYQKALNLALDVGFDEFSATRKAFSAGCACARAEGPINPSVLEAAVAAVTQHQAL